MHFYTTCIPYFITTTETWHQKYIQTLVVMWLCTSPLRVHRGGPGGAAHRGREEDMGSVEGGAWGLQPRRADAASLLHLPLPGHCCQWHRLQQSQRALTSPQHTRSWWVGKDRSNHFLNFENLLTSDLIRDSLIHANSRMNSRCLYWPTKF